MNFVKFTEEFVIYMEKHVLIKKCLKIGKIVNKKGQNCIQDGDRPTIPSTLEMVDSVNVLILADR